MARGYFCAYHSYLKAMRNLSDAECGRLFKALLRYSAGDTSIKLQGRESVAFDFITEQIDRDVDAYNAKCEQNRLNRVGTGDNDRQRPSTSVHVRDQGEGEGEGEGKGGGDEVKKPPAPPQPPPFADHPALQETFDTWLQYKRERRETLRPTGERMLISRIRNCAKKYGAEVMAEVIRDSMANNYQGIVFDWLEQRRRGGRGDGHRGDGGPAGPGKVPEGRRLSTPLGGDGV